MLATNTESVGHIDDTGTPSGHCKDMRAPARLSHSTMGPMARKSIPISMPIMARDTLLSDIGI